MEREQARGSQPGAGPEGPPESATLAQRPSSLPPVQARTSGRPRAVSSSIQPSGGTSSASSWGTALRSTASETVIAEAMVEEEAGRERVSAAIVATATVLVGAVVPVLGGDPSARWVCVSALAAMCAGSLGVWAVTGEPGRYTVMLHRLYSILLATCVLAVEYYVGYFSPVPVALTLGIYFIGQSRDRVTATAVPGVAIALYTGLALMTAFGWMEDRSLFPARDTSLDSKIFAVTAVALVLALTLKMAQVSRQSVRKALHKSHQALLVVAEREAQLEEARQNLDRALKAAVGKAGRYTGGLADDYELQLVIGLGAMGEVYAARHHRSGEQAAVKLLQAEAVQREDLVERFLREGEICRRLTSPHVVKVLKVGRMYDGSPFIIMEQLFGEDLGSRLRRGGHLPLRDAVTLASHTAKGLQCAHEAGIVHRDLKPHNLFLTRDAEEQPIWKILDFGVSKLAGSDGTLTANVVVGTPGYMSPEQARGEEVDHRSDLFSLAVVLYRALTGRQPFAASSTPEVLFEIVYKTPERPSTLRGTLPSDVDLVLAIALAKHVEHRFQSALDLARAFEAAAKRKLSPDLRARGQAVVDTYPWGRSLTDTLSSANVTAGRPAVRA